MSAPDISLGQMMLELEERAEDLAAAPGDPIDKRACFVRALAELERRAPELEHVDRELERLTAEAVGLSLGATPQQAMAVVSDLAALHESVQRLNALADLVSELAERLEDSVT